MKSARKKIKTIAFAGLLRCGVILFLMILVGTAYSNPKIYIIRHAAVDIDKPGWGSSKYSAAYKRIYNLSGVELFDPNEVLQKIEDYALIDTIFCSPQLRAMETAQMLFDKNVVIKIDSVLTELDYPVVHIPVVQFPVKGWLLISRISWMAGINQGEKTSYKERLNQLNAFSDELIKYAGQSGHAVVVAHGMVNHELVKILKKRGWEYCENGKDGHGNLSVNCLE
jgi:broad specificity phosphatase PhoE